MNPAPDFVNPEMWLGPFWRDANISDLTCTNLMEIEK